MASFKHDKLNRHLYIAKAREPKKANFCSKIPFALRDIVEMRLA